MTAFRQYSAFEIAIKSFLAFIIMISLAEMPADFYYPFRWTAFLGLGFLVVLAGTNGKPLWMFVWIAVLLLFQPFGVPNWPEALMRLLTLVSVVLLIGSSVLDMIAHLAQRRKRQRNPSNSLPANLDAVVAQRRAAQKAKSKRKR